MEESKELTIEDVQKELGKALNFLDGITNQLIKRYNEFHRLCLRQEEEIERIVSGRLDFLKMKKKNLWELYEEEEKKLQSEVDYLFDKLSTIKKYMERKNKTAVEQAKSDYASDK